MHVEAVNQPGIGGILVIMVLREVFTFLKSRKSTTDQLIKDLHEWHAVTDSDGVKVWYVRKSLTDSVAKLADSIQAFSGIIQNMATTQAQQTGVLEKISERLMRNKP